MEANLGVVEAYLEVEKAHPGAVKAPTLELRRAHLGAVEAHPEFLG